MNGMIPQLSCMACPSEELPKGPRPGRLTADYLKALCQWCLRGVHRPNVRSERRPSSKQLLLLHDLCFEFGLEQEPALQDAVDYFVESAGGQWPERHGAPLQYHKKRRYIRRAAVFEASTGSRQRYGGPPGGPRATEVAREGAREL